MANLDPAATPSLATATESGTALPNDKTIYLDIDLNNGVAAGARMTAVYRPDDDFVDGTVDILLWFHGHKGNLTSKTRSRPLNLQGFSAKQYLEVKEFGLREMIATTTKKNFVLVVPTLGDKSQAGLLGTESQAEAFLQQILNGLKTYTLGPSTSIGDMVIGAHSGGGAIMSVVSKFHGTFDRIKEIWCDDCTYGSGPIFKDWASKPGHAGRRLWVFSTGSWTDATSGARVGTGDSAKEVLDYAKSSHSTSIEELILPMSAGSQANWTYGVAAGHNESVGFYFPKLVQSSKTLS